MGLTEMQSRALEIELLNADLGKFAGEAPVSTIKRDLARALHEHPAAAPNEVVDWVIGCMDKLVTAWSRPLAHIDSHVVDGVRAAATVIAEAAHKAGLTPPVQPRPEQPGIVAEVDPATAEELQEDELLAAAVDELTEPMFGGI